MTSPPADDGKDRGDRSREGADRNRPTEPICPDGPSGLDSADWSPDGNAVVFDEPAFVFGSDSDIGLATVDAQGQNGLDVRFSNPAGLPLERLARLETIGVAGRHLVALRPAGSPVGSPGSTSWATLAADGSITEPDLPRDVADGFLPLAASTDGSVAALAILVPGPTGGQPQTDTVAPTRPSVEIVVFDGEEITPTVLQMGVPLEVVAG